MNATLAEWRVLDETTGEITDVKLTPKSKGRGRPLSVKGMHARVSKMVKYPLPRNSLRFIIDGRQVSAHRARADHVPFDERVERHRGLLRKRKFALAADEFPPVGQAAHWYDDVIQCVPSSGMHVARQLARLCGDDSQVTVPLRSLADAVGRMDSAGRLHAYTERGIRCLTEAGWLSTQTSGTGQTTTFYLLPGDRRVEWYPVDDNEWDVLNEDEWPFPT